MAQLQDEGSSWSYMDDAQEVKQKWEKEESLMNKNILKTQFVDMDLTRSFPFIFFLKIKLSFLVPNGSSARSWFSNFVDEKM